MGAFIIPSDGRPSRAIILENQPTKLPPGFVWSPECASRLGKTNSELRGMRSRPPGEDRGPWPPHKIGGWRIAYRIEDIKSYLAGKAAKLRAKADALIARGKGEPPAEPLSPADAQALAELAGKVTP